jgi:hypothetical protein
MALQLVVDFLPLLHFPKPNAGLLFVMMGRATLVGILFLLSGPTSVWLAKVRESMESLQIRFAGDIKVIDTIEKTGKKVKEISPESNTTEVSVKGPPISTVLLTLTRADVTGLLTTAVLLYFLIVSGVSA